MRCCFSCKRSKHPHTDLTRHCALPGTDESKTQRGLAGLWAAKWNDPGLDSRRLVSRCCWATCWSGSRCSPEAVMCHRNKILCGRCCQPLGVNVCRWYNDCEAGGCWGTASVVWWRMLQREIFCSLLRLNIKPFKLFCLLFYILFVFFLADSPPLKGVIAYKLSNIESWRWERYLGLFVASLPQTSVLLLNNDLYVDSRVFRVSAVWQWGPGVTR